MKLFTLAILILLSTAANAQVEFSLSMGYGSYLMSDMKDFQQEVKKSFVADARVTDEFPSYFIYQVSAKTILPNLVTGLTLSYGSTGGRVYYSDYSATLSSDQLMSFYGIHAGLGDRWDIWHKKLSVTFDLKPGVTLTKLHLKDRIQVQSNADSESVHLKSINIGFEPTVNLSRNINVFQLSIFAGYHFTLIEGKLRSTENKDAYLVINDREVHAQWDGIRAGFGIAYRLKTWE